MSKGKRFPFEFVDMNDEQKKSYTKYFTAKQSSVFVGPKRYFMLEAYKRDAHNFYNMPLRADDIIVCTYPRSGTTWTQEMVWLLNNNLDYLKAQDINLIDRFPFLESTIFFSDEDLNKSLPMGVKQKQAMDVLTTPTLEVLAKSHSPRFIKTHLPLSFLPPTLVNTTKVVFVARDVRDVMVSNYYFYRDNYIQNYIGDFKHFYDLFIKGLVPFAPSFEHVREAWELRHHPNLLFLFYEDLITDLEGSVRRVAKFFDKQYTDEQFARLAEHLKFDNFKDNKAMDVPDYKNAGLFKHELKLVRKGKAGEWRKYFDEEMTLKAERWIQENLQGTDLVFPQTK